MPPKRVAKNSKPVVPVKVHSNSKNIQKEIAVIESLHDAENHQLTSFIKTRSMELDKDIKSLRQKLKLSDSTMENDELTSRSAGNKLSVSGVGLGRVNLDSDAISHTYVPKKPENPTFKLDPAHTKTQSKPTVKDHVVLFLARIKLSKLPISNLNLHLFSSNEAVY